MTQCPKMGLYTYPSKGGGARFVEEPVSPYFQKTSGSASNNKSPEKKQTIAVASPVANLFKDRTTAQVVEGDYLRFGSKKHSWFVLAVRELDAVANLRDNWNTYGAPKPAMSAIVLARRALDQLFTRNLPRPDISPSGEGGVTLSFFKQDKYADIEFLNSNEVLAVIARRGTPSRAWSLGSDRRSVSDALDEIASFIA